MSSKVAKVRQVLAAFSSTLGAFGLGTTIAWTSPAIPHLDPDLCKDHCAVDGLSKADLGWIGAFMPLGAVVSGPITGYLLNTIGRRWTMIAYSAPLALGYILLTSVPLLEMGAFPLFFGRFLTGFAAASFALSAPTYIVEIAEPDLRGSLASLMQLMVTIGIAFVNALDIGLSWVPISSLCVVAPSKHFGFWTLNLPTL